MSSHSYVIDMLCCTLRQLQDALQQQAARLNAAAAERLDVLATAHAAVAQGLLPFDLDSTHHYVGGTPF
jgi:hypothetical protein